MGDGSRFFSDEKEEKPEKQSLFVKEEADEDDEDIQIIPVSQEDERYTLFESEITAIIPDICLSRVNELFGRFKDDPQPVMSAVNSYFNTTNFSERDATGAQVQSAPVRTGQFYPPTSTHRASPYYNYQTPQRKQPTILQSLSQSRNPPAGLSGVRKLSQPTVDHKPAKRIKTVVPVKPKPLDLKVKWRRFIGSFQVTGWATRPTMSPIPYGTKLSIVRSVNNSTSKRKSIASNNVSNVKLVQHADDPVKMKEIGRIPEDIANILYPLIGEGNLECDFDVTVVLCESRLSIGDSFILQLDCFLTNLLFDACRAGQQQNSVETDVKALRQMKGFNNSTTIETEAEMIKRKKQMALFKLFQRLDHQLHLQSEQSKEEVVIDLDDEECDGGTDNDNSNSEDNDKVEDLNVNQLKEFYRRTQITSSLASLPETSPPNENFKLDLRSYQKQGLTWMLRAERELVDKDHSEMMNPLWKEFYWPKDRSWDVSRNEDLRQPFDDTKFYANLYSSEFSSEKPLLSNVCRGGILADEMGLGKTISTLALIHSVPFDKEYQDSKEELEEKDYAYRTTLIVVPTSLLTQWDEEFNKANNDGSTSLVYYGTETNFKLNEKLCGSDDSPMVVITTYGTLQSEWNRLAAKVGNDHTQELPKEGLFSVKWFRVVLDEAHNIRTRTNKTTKACYDLQCSRRWLLTGTPIINRLDDLFSLVKFLKLEPWSNIQYWNTFVSKPFENKKYSQALDVIQSILEPIILRRTKQMKQSNGKPLVELPEKEVIIERIKFSPKEQALYNWFLSRAANSVNQSIAKGDVLKKYSTILTMILRLRQICDHMDLISGGVNGDEMEEDASSLNILDDVPKELLITESDWEINEFNQVKSHITNTFPDMNSIKEIECSICTENEIQDIIFTECGHGFCSSCLLEYIDYKHIQQPNQELNCPNCRFVISSDRLLKVKNEPDYLSSKDYTLVRFNNNLRSSKLNALLSHLRRIKDTSPNEKVVVFSQFSMYLDILERELSKEPGLNVFKFDGRMSLNARSVVLKSFKESNDGVTVLLLSLKAGGVGLNLTEASIAFMCDPWWSPSVEDQAIDRIHRIGQESNVKVIRFIMEGTIEEKMLKIQERKRTIGEVVEAEEEERRNRRIEEIQMLFN